MDKQEANEILVSAMGSLFTEAEIEAQIAETSGISREELNKIIENGEEMPECIKKYREINRQRKTFEEKLITHELRENRELVAKPTLLVVFSHFPQFQQDYEILKIYGYISETEKGLEWKKTIQSLAEYFGNLPLPYIRKTRPWKDIEILFGIKHLKNSFSKNGNAFKNNPSIDYEKLQKILSRNTPNGK